MINIYSKIQSLYTLQKLKLNTHYFIIPNNYNEYLNIINTWKYVTIRTDHKRIKNDLPFYIVNLNINDLKGIQQIWDNAQKHQYKLIISNGIQYDNSQEYNLVVKLQSNGDFIFEASELKIPLRHMYKYPLLSAIGNIKDQIHNWNIINQKYGINKINIKSTIETLYTYKIYNKWLEITKYPYDVGMLNKNIIFWEIKE